MLSGAGVRIPVVVTTDVADWLGWRIGSTVGPFEEPLEIGFDRKCRGGGHVLY